MPEPPEAARDARVLGRGGRRCLGGQPTERPGGHRGTVVLEAEQRGMRGTPGLGHRDPLGQPGADDAAGRRVVGQQSAGEQRTEGEPGVHEVRRRVAQAGVRPVDDSGEAAVVVDHRVLGVDVAVAQGRLEVPQPVVGQLCLPPWSQRCGLRKRGGAAAQQDCVSGADVRGGPLRRAECVGDLRRVDGVQPGQRRSQGAGVPARRRKFDHVPEVAGALGLVGGRMAGQRAIADDELPVDDGVHLPVGDRDAQPPGQERQQGPFPCHLACHLGAARESEDPAIRSAVLPQQDTGVPAVLDQPHRPDAKVGRGGARELRPWGDRIDGNRDSARASPGRYRQDGPGESTRSR